MRRRGASDTAASAARRPAPQRPGRPAAPQGGGGAPSEPSPAQPSPACPTSPGHTRRLSVRPSLCLSVRPGCSRRRARGGQRGGGPAVGARGGGAAGPHPEAAADFRRLLRPDPNTRTHTHAHVVPPPPPRHGPHAACASASLSPSSLLHFLAPSPLRGWARPGPAPPPAGRPSAQRGIQLC